MNGDPKTAQRGIVLVVDDDPDIREAFGAVLEHAGYAVHEASDGQEALDLLVTMARPCVILLDLMMPGMSGIEFIEAVRTSAMFVTIPIVVVSAYSQHFDALVNQVSRVLRKPVDRRSLLDSVRSICTGEESLHRE